jgi:hypothetical protein
MQRSRMVTLFSGFSALMFGWATASAQALTPPPGTAHPQGEADVTAPPYGTSQPVESTPPAPPPPPYGAPTVIVEDDDAVPPPVVYEERPVNVYVEEPRPRRAMTISLGGGVSDFTDATLRDRTGLNAAYEARLAIGTNSPFAVEAAYVGTAGGIETLGLDDNAMLISNGVEGLARLNLGTFDFQPYVVGGASWVRYNIVNASFNTSDMRNSDDIIAVPLGAGISTYLGNSGLVLDARFTYRLTFDDDLVRATPENSDGSSLNNWVAALKLGYAF